MKTQQAIAHFGGRQQLADAINRDRSLISKWGEFVPERQQYHLEVITNGALKASISTRSTHKKAA